MLGLKLNHVSKRGHWGLYEATERLWWYDHIRRMTTEKYDYNGEGWYFRFDDDNTMSYKYALQIT